MNLKLRLLFINISASCSSGLDTGYCRYGCRNLRLISLFGRGQSTGNRPCRHYDLRTIAQNCMGYCFSLDHLRLFSRLWWLCQSVSIVERILATRSTDLLRLLDPLRLPQRLLLGPAEAVLLHNGIGINIIFRSARYRLWIRFRCFRYT